MTSCSPLSKKQCVPCQGGVPPLSGQSLQDLFHQLSPGWKLIGEHHLEKEFSFSQYLDGISFVDKLAHLAEAEGHHPDLIVRWRKVKVLLWTHKIDGLTESDFIFAAKADELFSSQP